MNSAVANVLNDVLGSWVENINSEQLKLSVFSGKILLENLLLRRTALESLGLPFNLVYGKIKKIKVDIPWTALASRPLTIKISGIYILTCPTLPQNWNEETEMKNTQDFKRTYLENYEAVSFAETSVPEDKGFMEKLVNKMVQNVQISIKNVYLRYEDTHMSLRPFVIGLMIHRLSAVTCDKNWEKKFMEAEDINYKFLQLSDLRVFLDYGENFVSLAENGFKDAADKEMEEIIEIEELN